MKEIYRKTSIFSFIGGSITAVYAIVYYFIWFESFVVNGDTLIASVSIRNFFTNFGTIFQQCTTEPQG